MKKLIPLCLALIACFNGLACSSSDDSSTCAAAKAQTDISAECISCVKSKCNSQYNNFCSSCDTGSAGGSNTSNACVSANEAVGECAETACPVCIPSSGAGGATSGSGGATSSNAGATAASGDGEACTVANTGCQFYPSSTIPAASAESACTMAGGTPSPHCPTANLVGCCAADDGTLCYYVGTAADLQSECSNEGGTWTTTAP